MKYQTKKRAPEIAGKAVKERKGTSDNCCHCAYAHSTTACYIQGCPHEGPGCGCRTPIHCSTCGVRLNGCGQYIPHLYGVKHRRKLHIYGMNRMD